MGILKKVKASQGNLFALGISLGLHLTVLGLALLGADYTNPPGKVVIEESYSAVFVTLESPLPPKPEPPAPIPAITRKNLPQESAIPQPITSVPPTSNSADQPNNEIYIPPRLPLDFSLKYPHQARRLGWEGKCAFFVNVDPQGNVISVVLDETSGKELLDRSAKDQLLITRFLPGMRGSKTVTAQERVVLIYRLDKKM